MARTDASQQCVGNGCSHHHVFRFNSVANLCDIETATFICQTEFYDFAIVCSFFFFLAFFIGTFLKFPDGFCDTQMKSNQNDMLGVWFLKQQKKIASFGCAFLKFSLANSSVKQTSLIVCNLSIFRKSVEHQFRKFCLSCCHRYIECNLVWYGKAEVINLQSNDV